MRLFFCCSLLVLFVSCDKYKKLCHDVIDPKIESFAYSVALSCDGDKAKALDFFNHVPSAVCGKKLAQELAGHENDSEEQIASIACPLITHAVIGGGAKFVEKGVGCKKPIDVEFVKALVDSTLCVIF